MGRILIIYWHYSSDIQYATEPCGLPCNPICLAVLSCSILILGCLPRWLRGFCFPLWVCVKLNVGHCRYGSVVPLCTVAILSSWFSLVYPPGCMLLTTALMLHCRIVGVHRGQKGVKNSTWQLKISHFSVVVASALKPKVLSTGPSNNSNMKCIIQSNGFNLKSICKLI